MAVNTCTQNESVKTSVSHPGHATGLYNHPHSLNQLSLMLEASSNWKRPCSPTVNPVRAEDALAASAG